MKPEWCPQDVWEKARRLHIELIKTLAYAHPSEDEIIARALLEAEQRGRREMLPLVEQAYRDGLTYATICEVEDKDLAWEQSSIRAKMQAKLGEVQK